MKNKELTPAQKIKRFNYGYLLGMTTRAPIDGDSERINKSSSSLLRETLYYLRARKDTSVLAYWIDEIEKELKKRNVRFKR